MPSPQLSSAAQQRLHEILAPLVDAVGCDLEEVTVSPAGRRSVVRVVVDADGGVDLDAVAAVSRTVAEALDDLDQAPGGAPFTGPYVLEVSSPGVDRPLTEPRHWRRNVGRLIEVPLGPDGARRIVVGRVIETDETGITLNVDRVPVAVPWAELGTGRVQIEFNRSDGDHEMPDGLTEDVIEDVTEDEE